MANPIITKIGDVSAYLDAVAHGFEGTRAEFGELLANSANYAQSAESAASAASASAATATTKAMEATTAATAAQTAKTQTEAAASQALTDISTAEFGAISAVQTEGATQTANARTQAQAAAQSATTASTKASEASASATSAEQSATNAAASATSAANAASAAQDVLESIPQDYSDLSEDVDKLNESLGNNTDYLKKEKYDTRLSTSNVMGIGHFVDSSTPATNGNYSYYRHTALIPLQDFSVEVSTPVDSDLLMAVPVFDANGDFIATPRINTNLSSGTYTNTVAWITRNGKYDTATYFRLEFYRYPYANITSDITVKPADDSQNIAVKTNFIEGATLNTMSITLDKTGFTNGYLNNDGNLIASNDYKVSPFISVVEQMVVTITKLQTANWKLIFCYNEQQTLIKSIAYNSNTNTMLDTVDIFIPGGTKYIRYVIPSGMLSATTISYKMDNIPKHYLAPSLIERWNEKTFGKMNELFVQATNRALITIIDDDTHSTAVVQSFHDACEAQGIKGSFAVITSRFSADADLKNTLLGYEESGYGICAHCYVQDSKWNPPTSNMSSCEQDMVKCIRDLQNAGFINFKHWLTPGGHVERDVQDLAKRLGMHCAVSSGWSEIETTEAKYGRYAIRRCSLEVSDSGTALTIDQFKALIDEAVACNGWLLITTHFGNGQWDATAIANRFDAVVDYAQSKYMKFCTLQEAWAIRRPIYEFYEKF